MARVNTLCGLSGMIRTVCFSMTLLLGAFVSVGSVAQQPLPNPNLIIVRNAQTQAIARQADGKILIASSGVAEFRYLSPPGDDGPRLVGEPGPGPANAAGVQKRGLVRVNTDGSLDTAFTVDLDEDANGDTGQIGDIRVSGNFAYVLGDFTSIGGVKRAGLARINLTTNTVDANWNPNPVRRIPDQTAVGSMALDASGNLYTFGSLYDIGGKLNVRVAKILASSTTGAADTAFDGSTVAANGSADDIVASGIAIGPGANAPIYVFGRKSQFGPNRNTRINRINPITGVPDSSWAPDLTAIDMLVNGIAVNSAGDLFVGGQSAGNAVFGEGTTSPYNLVKLSGSSGQVAPGWVGGRNVFNGNAPFVAVNLQPTLDASGNVFAMALLFYSDTSQIFPAKYDGTTGLPIAGFNGQFVEGSQTSVGYSLVAPDGLFVAGPGYYGLTRVNSTLLKLDATTGALQSGFNVNLKTSGLISSSTRMADGRVIMGGAFNEVNGVQVNNLIRFNADGTFDPTFTNGPAGLVIGLQEIAGKLYVGGGFASAGGQPRQFVAKFDSASGALDTAWAPVLNGSARGFAGDANDIYMSGGFVTINGVFTKCVVKLSATTGVVDLAWAPALANVVNGVLCQRAIAKVGNYVYLGMPNTFGPIGSPRVIVNGQNRTLARIDAVTGQVDNSFDPNPSNSVNSMATDGTTLYVSGNFGRIGSVNTRLAKFDGVTGAIDPAFVQPLTGIPGFPTFMRIAPNGIFLVGNDNVFAGDRQSVRPFVWKILANGARDTGWNLSFQYEGQSSSFNAAVEPLGPNRVIVGGGFGEAGSLRRVGRLAVAAFSTVAPLTLTLNINGKGTVDATSNGGAANQQCFDCIGGPFTYEFDTASTVTLTARPLPGWVFVGWLGNNAAASCTTTGPCVLSLTASTTVSASFRNVANYIEQ
jgi:hypothetical protein